MSKYYRQKETIVSRCRTIASSSGNYATEAISIVLPSAQLIRVIKVQVLGLSFVQAYCKEIASVQWMVPAL